MEKGTVFVGLSGGVDSAVSALRLKQQGYKVVGVFIKVWHPDFLVCNWEAERLDAMRIAAHLEIPFLTCDAEEAYRDGVAKYFIEEYKAGRTPNPDVMCNQYVKFGAFLDFAKAKGADFIATGHYAQHLVKEGIDELHRGVDAGKDQTYFLWTLSKDQLAKSLFPVGDTPKEEIRKEAKKAGLPVAQKKDSQGVCFLGHIDIPEFLSHYVYLETGAVLDETGQVIGEHKGALVYTLGQRHGFTINSHDPDRKPFFVASKDLRNNTITVATERKKALDDFLKLDGVVLRKILSVGERVEIQTRYRQPPLQAEVAKIDVNEMEIKLKEPVDLPAVGQSCVLYQGSLCLGGGIIE